MSYRQRLARTVAGWLKPRPELAALLVVRARQERDAVNRTIDGLKPLIMADEELWSRTKTYKPQIDDILHSAFWQALAILSSQREEGTHVESVASKPDVKSPQPTSAPEAPASIASDEEMYRQLGNWMDIEKLLIVIKSKMETGMTKREAIRALYAEWSKVFS